MENLGFYNKEINAPNGLNIGPRGGAENGPGDTGDRSKITFENFKTIFLKKKNSKFDIFHHFN